MALFKSSFIYFSNSIKYVDISLLSTRYSRTGQSDVFCVDGTIVDTLSLLKFIYSPMETSNLP